MSKTQRYKDFTEWFHCFSYHYQNPPLDLGLDKDKTTIIEVWCGSGAYTKLLAERDPKGQYIGVDSKSDRMSFGNKYCIDHNIKNVRWVYSQVDHLRSFIPEKSIDHIWITFPDPRPTRDRQKLTSPKYQIIYWSLLKPWWILHLKTDDLRFFEYTQHSLTKWWRIISSLREDIYHATHNQPWEYKEIFDPVISIQTYYETQWLQQGRVIYYLSASFNEVKAL